MKDFMLTVQRYLSDIRWLSSGLQFWIIILSVLSLGILLGLWIKSHRQKTLKTKITRLELLLEISHENKHDELMDLLQQTNQDTLNHHTESFLRLANENFSKHQQQAHHVFNDKQQSIATLITPLQEALKQTKQQAHDLENTRKMDYGKISEQLRSVNQTQKVVEDETKQLVNALRRPEVRGAWGELSLKRLLELSGLNDYADFSEQVSVESNSSLLRPDLIINLPENRCLVIDAKTPLDAYLDAIKHTDKIEIKHHMQRHYKNVKAQITSLASKKYWQQFETSPDFVILFIPNDNFLSAALEVDNSLIEFALEKKILLATPTSLVGLLRTVAHGWRQFTLSSNAKELQKIGTELHNCIHVFNEHFAKLGKGLQQSVDLYNKSVGSMQKNITPSLNKFTELGVSSPQETKQPQKINTSTRDLL